MNLALVCEKKENKKITPSFLVGVFLLGLLVFIGCLNTQNPDFINYKVMYENLVFNKNEFVFYYIMTFGRLLDLPFFIFRFFIYLISFGLLFNFASKYTTNLIGFSVLYFLYPFLYNVIQTRNFIGIILLCLAIDILIQKKNPLYKIQYILLITIATFIQNVFVLFLPFAFFDNFNKKKATSLLLAMLIIVSSIFVVFPQEFISIVFDVLDLLHIDMGNRQHYVDNIQTKLSIIIFIAEVVFNIFVSFFNYKFIEKYSTSDIHKRFLQVDLALSLYSVFFLPFIRLNANFIRTVQNLLVVKHIANLIVFEENKDINETKTWVVLALYYGYIIVSFLYLFVFLRFNDIVVDVLFKNIFSN